ncbi:MAG: hypothetical protein U5L96_15145 [Owenweeksia sp.]|nr:hypothetical protein [Owenweeksia sp.]
MKKLYPLLLLSVILTSACETENEVDPPKRYLKSVRIVALPALQYDTDGSPPDLRVDLKRRSTNFWEFSTETLVNAGNLPAFLNFPAEVLGTDEVYEIRIIDEDPDNRLIMKSFFGTFI